jgi:NhaP-type Na+/H+ or K+/H+ antiporter
LLWATAVGIALGAALGGAAGRLVVYLRSRHGEAVGLDEFLALGLVGMAYGVAQISHASGFLAVFAAGLALQRVSAGSPSAALASVAVKDESRTDAIARADLDHAGDMRDSVQAFNEQLEKLAEMALVLMVGAMLAYARPLPALWWFVPLMLLVLRPLAVMVALPGEGLSRPQQAMIGWFGIRGIGSVYYLLFAVSHGVQPEIAEPLVSLTLWTVAASIVAHGITAQPLMSRYIGWRARTKRSP